LGGYDATDEEVLKQFSSLVDDLGGQTVANWITALALATSRENIICETFQRQTILTSESCSERIPGSPLQSMQLNPETGQYLARMSQSELRAYYRKSMGFYEFVQTNLSQITN